MQGQAKWRSAPTVLHLPRVVLATVFCMGAVFAQQTERPVFRTSADGVQLDVSVVDAEGRPVADLTPDDFEILENGVRQEITTFARIGDDSRTTTARLNYAEPDVRTNTSAVGRVYVFALDEVAPEMAPVPGICSGSSSRRTFALPTSARSRTSGAGCRTAGRASPAAEAGFSPQSTASAADSPLPPPTRSRRPSGAVTPRSISSSR